MIANKNIRELLLNFIKGGDAQRRSQVSLQEETE